MSINSAIQLEYVAKNMKHIYPLTFFSICMAFTALSTVYLPQITREKQISSKHVMMEQVTNEWRKFIDLF